MARYVGNTHLHWFFVIFHPDFYPMNITWIDGKITLEELKHHHPEEYERFVRERESKNQKEDSDEQQA